MDLYGYPITFILLLLLCQLLKVLVISAFIEYQFDANYISIVINSAPSCTVKRYQKENNRKVSNSQAKKS